MIEKGENIKVRKVGVVDDPDQESASWNEFVEGVSNPKSLPVDYEVKGRLHGKLSETFPLVVERHERNGVKKMGYMRTSPIQSIEETDEGVVAKTMNSIYLIHKDEQ